MVRVTVGTQQRAVILFFRDGEGYQLGCAGAVTRLAQAFISYV